jgi:hypothetical protein
MNLTVPGFILITGLCGAGKSHALRYIMATIQHKFTWGIAFSNTKGINNNLDYIPQQYVHQGYNPEKLKKFMQAQRKYARQGRPILGYVILDDASFDSWRNCDLFKSLTSQYRHYNVLIIISTQVVRSVVFPNMKSNVMQVLMFRTDQDQYLKSLYQDFGFAYGTDSQFCNTLIKMPKYTFLYYDRTADHRQYHIYKCPSSIPPFLITPTCQTRNQ